MEIYLKAVNLLRETAEENNYPKISRILAIYSKQAQCFFQKHIPKYFSEYELSFFGLLQPKLI